MASPGIIKVGFQQGTRQILFDVPAASQRRYRIHNTGTSRMLCSITTSTGNQQIDIESGTSKDVLAFRISIEGNGTTATNGTYESLD